MSRRTISHERGYTFLEMVMVLAILALMALVVERTLASAGQAERQLDANRRATERCEKVAYEILDDTERSRKLFGGDAVGLGYLDALDLTRDPLHVAARMPVFEEVAPLGPDEVDEPRTGNILLFARETDAADCIADPATGKVRYIDMYRFICVYPRATDRYVVVEQDKQLANDIVIWRSVRFPNYSQITGITDEDERESVIADLVTRFECEFAWEPTGSVTDAFFEMTSSGVISGTAEASMTIDEDVDQSDRGRVVYANCQLAPTVAGDYHRKSVFTVDDPAEWTPGGLEIKIVGPSGARKVWIHVVLEAQSGDGILGVQASTVIASTKDL